MLENTYICKFCEKVCKNSNSLRNHERLCKENPNRQLTYFQTNQDDVQKLKKELYPYGCNQYTKARFLGLPKPIVAEETKEKIRQANLKRTKEWHIENGKKISNTIRKKVEEGTWHNSVGKHKIIFYRGIKFDSSWEVKYAKYLDCKNIKWTRETEKFKYFFEGKYHWYQPDFYLLESDVYIEIKGYKRPRDDAKWNQFPKDKKLNVLMYNDLKLLGLLDD